MYHANVPFTFGPPLGEETPLAYGGRESSGGSVVSSGDSATGASCLELRLSRKNCMYSPFRFRFFQVSTLASI